MSNWIEELEKVNKCKIRQDSLNAQLNDLIKIANKFGFYDASDFILKKFIGKGWLDDCVGELIRFLLYKGVNSGKVLDLSQKKRSRRNEFFRD